MQEQNKRKQKPSQTNYSAFGFNSNNTPLNDVQKIAGRPFSLDVLPSNSMYLAKQSVRKIHEDAKRKEAEERRRIQERIDTERRNQKALEDRKKRAAEFHEQRRKEREEARKQVAIADQLDEERRIKSGYVGYNRYVGYDGRLDFAMRLAWNLKNYFGSGTDTGTKMHADELVGKISENDLRIYQAEAHKKSLKLQDQINGLEMQKQLLFERSLPSDIEQIKGKAESDPAIKAVFDKAGEYDAQISRLRSQLEDPELKALDDSYKIDFVKDNRGFFEKAADFISNDLLSTTYPKYQQLVNDRRTQNYLSRYQEAVDYKTKSELDKQDREEHKDFGLLGRLTQKVRKNIKDKPGFDISSKDETKKSSKLDEAISKDNQIKQSGLMLPHQDINKQNVFADETIEDSNIKNKELQNDYVRTLELNQALNDWFQVSEGYKMGIEASRNLPWWNAAYLHYLLPTLFGGSNSSPELIAATAIRLAGAAASPFTGGATLLASEAIATPFEIGGGRAENYGERAQKRNENIINLLKDPSIGGKSGYDDIMSDLVKKSRKYWKTNGMSEEWINQHISENNGQNVIQDYNAGIITSNDPRLKRAELLSTRGLRAQFDANNMRTMGELAVQKASMLLPWSRVKNVMSIGADNLESRIFGKSAAKIVADKSGKVVMESVESGAKRRAKEAVREAAGETYKNGFRRRTISEAAKSGYMKGAAVGEALGLGYGGTVVTGVAGSAIESGLHLTRRMLPRKMRASLDMWENQARNYYQILADITPKQVRLFNKYLGKGAAMATVSGIAEKNEEQGQYLNSKKDFASQYGWLGMSVSQMFENDFEVGTQLAQANLAMLGIGHSELLNDQEFIENGKGGFLMGLFHTGVVRVAGDIKGAYKEYTTQEILENSSVINREADKINRTNYATIASLAMQGKGASVIDVLQQRMQDDSRRESPEFRQEDHERLISDAQKIIRMSQNGNVRKMLEAKGFQYGTQEYANALADIQNIEQEMDDNRAEHRTWKSLLDSIYHSKSFVDSISNVTANSVLNIANGNSDRLSKLANAAADKAEKEEIERAKASGEDINTDEFKARIQEIRNEAKDSEVESQSVLEAQRILNKTRLVNQIRGLLQLRAKQNTVENWHQLITDKLGVKIKTPDAGVVKKNVDENLSNAKKLLSKLDKSISEEMSDADLLKALDGISDVVQMSEEEIANVVQVESNVAALDAAYAVSKKYHDEFTDGFTVDADGNIAYNGKLGSTNNNYYKRIARIMEANEENAKLQWAVEDIYAGDAVTKLQEEFDEDRLSRAKEESSQIQAENKEAQVKSNPFDAPKQDVKTDAKINQKADALRKNNEKFQARKKKAQSLYERNKARYKKWKRGNLNATIVPMQDLIVNTANELLKYAQIGAYKFAEFVEDMKEILGDRDYKSSAVAIKKAYIMARAKNANNPETLGNFSDIDEISAYEFDPKPSSTSPSIPNNSKGAQVQSELNKDYQKVVQNVSSFFDTIVQDDNIPYEVKVYPNQSSIELSPSLSNSAIDEVLKKYDLTSGEGVKQMMLDASSGEVTEEQIKFFVDNKDVDGIMHAAYRLCKTMKPSKSVIDAINIRNAAIAVMLGNEAQINKSNFIDGIDDFIAQLKNLRESILKAGWQVIDANQNIYGSGMSAQCDLLFITPNGEFAVLDVASSYRSIVDSYDSKPSQRLNYTNREKQEGLLHSIEKILADKFGIPCKMLGTIPVVYDDRHNYFKIETKLDGNINIIKTPVHIQQSDNSLEANEIKDRCLKIGEQIEQLAEEYNYMYDLYADIVPDTITRAEIDQQKGQAEQSTVELYRDYLNSLETEYNNLIQSKEDLQQAIYQHIESIASSEDYIVDAEAPSAQSEWLYDNLVDRCKELDEVMEQMPIGKATTKEEKLIVRRIYESIFDAQLALNDLLSNTEASGFDVTKEEEVIASAMETLVEDTQNFPGMSAFVKRWWVTQFDLRSDTNVAKTNLLQSYYNTIYSWTKTLQDHVINDELDNRPRLQSFYSALLNNYFAKLLDNAEKIIPTLSDDDKVFMRKYAIEPGRLLIDQFNSMWNAEPMGDLNGLTQDELANRINVTWNDLYGKSEKHSPAFDAMKINDNYVWMSKQPDFLQKATFAFAVAGKTITVRSKRYGKYTIPQGDLYVHVRYTDSNGKEHWADLPFIADINNYPEAYINDELRDRILTTNRGNRKFIKRVLAVLKAVENDKKNREVVFDMTLDKGTINYGEVNEYHNVNEFLFNGDNNKQDLYTILLGKENRIGILKTIIPERGEATYGVIGKTNVPFESFNKEYQKGEIRINSGAIIYFYDTGDGRTIGVPIESMKIGDNDNKSAAALSDLICRYSRGERSVDGYDIMDLLKMRLYMNDGDQIDPHKNVSNMITISPSGDIFIGDTQFDASNPSLITEAIQQMPSVVDRSTLSENINNSSNKAFSIALAKLQNSNAESIELPNGIVLSKDDFVHQNQDGSLGTTWLGYLLRNEYLKTRAIGSGYRQINFANVRWVTKGTQQITKRNSEELTARRRTNSTRRRSVFDDAVSALNKIVKEDEFVERNGSQKSEFASKVREYCRKVLGDNGSVDFESPDQRYLKRVSSDAAVAGVCTAEAIKMSTSAPESVMFHEAFHKILELVLPEKVRESFYEYYRNNVPGGAGRTDRQVAEGLADLFTDYMTIKQDVKNLPWYKKFSGWFNQIAFGVGMTSYLGLPGTIKMLWLYRNINRGKYAGEKISEKNKQRFVELFGDELHYTVTNQSNLKTAKFEYINNASDLNEIVSGIACMIMRAYDLDKAEVPQREFRLDEKSISRISQEDIDYLCGNDLDDSELDEIHMAWREIFFKEKIIKKDDKGNTYYDIQYPNFSAIMDNVSRYIASVMKTTPTVDIESVDDEDLAAANNMDKYDKASYEFNKLDSISQRVKFFFATIPYTVPVTDENDNTIYVLDTTRNKYDVETFIPIQKVWGMVVNKLHGVKSVKDLYEKLEYLANQSTESASMYREVFNKFKELYTLAWKYDNDGNLIDIDYDKESFVVLIFEAIKSLNLDFTIAKSKHEQEGGKSVKISSLSNDIDSIRFPKQWTQMLLSGQVAVFSRSKSANGELVFRDGMGGTNGNDIFSTTASFFQSLINEFSKGSTEVVISGTRYDLTSHEAIGRLKQLIINRLNRIGINISIDALDYMLSEGQFESTGVDALAEWITRGGNTSCQSFINTLNTWVNNNGAINKNAVQQGYSRIGFVTELGDWQGRYNRATTDMQRRGIGGKSLYGVSQNHTISLQTDVISSKDKQNPLLSRLLKFSYNVMRQNGFNIGSILLKGVLNNTLGELKLHTHNGYRSDNRNDEGADYKEQKEVEDYISKMEILQQGGLIFPTLSDKGTWVYLTGVDLPGMSIKRSGNDISVSGAPSIMWVNDKPYLRPNDAVLRQFLEYAQTERLAIFECMELLGYENIPGYEKQGLPILTEEQKIENYHKGGNKQGVEPNGTRFLSLTLIVVLEDGKLNEYNLNNPIKSSIDRLKLANEKFFDKPVEEQLDILAYTLAVLNQLEVEKAIELGLVYRDDTALSKADDGTFMNLHSNNFSQSEINAIALAIIANVPNWNSLERGTPAFNERFEICKGLAIAAKLGDACNRSIMSTMEVERCYCGHPAQFTVVYDKLNGVIKDSSADIQKRLGGLVSTGDDNALDLPGIPSSYTCAEVNDYKIGSSAKVMEFLREVFYDNIAREIHANLTGDYDTAYSGSANNPRANFDKDSDDYKKRKESLEKLDPRAKNKAKELADAFYNSYINDINVADGAAYITPKMCENLLRMRGALNSETKRAIDILSGDSKYTWMLMKDAYKVIYDNLNFTAMKYTAYGFRDHEASNMSVAYYNKFALFPVFPCMATGKMKGVLEKMQSEDVDMLLMTSAVKVGSQGATSFDGDKIVGKLNKYVQDFQYLRRQLNTEPEEGDRNNAGTQMVKISLQNLETGRTYLDDETGQQIKGELLLDKYMNAIKQLAKLGLYKLQDEFFVDGTNNVDPQKLSKFLKNELGSRGASKALIEAIQVVDDGGQKKLVAPLASTSESSWIESIVISHVNKRVIDIQTPGSSFIQMSAFALEGKLGDNEGTMQFRKIYNGLKLEPLNTEGSMDAVISIDYFSLILPNGLSFDEARQYLIDRGIIGDKAKATTVGYRIPTQAESSIHALRFVDVVPAVKSTIILPAEFTKITGSDFDIDHLYLASMNWNKQYNEETGEYVYTTNFEMDDKNLQKIYENQFLHCILTLLKDQNSLNHLYKSIDNDTSLAKGIADEIEDQLKVKHYAFNFGSLHELVQKRSDFIIGKFGIGPFALNVTSLVLTRLYNVEFKQSRFTLATGIESLHKSLDNKLNSIDSWVSAFINAHVDIAKDPWVSKLNVNKFTYNMLNLLVRCGYGDSSVWFLTQPAIKDLARASENAQSQYLFDPSTAKSIYEAGENALKEVYEKYIPNAESTIQHAMENERVRINSVKFIRDYPEVLAHFAKGNRQSITVERNGKKETFSFDYAQYTSILAWKSLEPYANALGELVQHTKIDTKKHGNNLISIYKYFTEFTDMLNSTNSIFNRDSIINLVNDSFIGIKTALGINTPFNILGDQTFNGNIDFIETVMNYAKKITAGRGIITDKLLNKISRSLQTLIKSRYFIDIFVKQYMGKDDNYISGLFIGPYSMNHRFNMINDAMRNMPQYERLLNNTLLQQISSQIERGPISINGKVITMPGFLDVLQSVDADKHSQDLLIDGWEDLLKDRDKFVRDFARDLIVYAFVSSGEFRGWNKLIKYLPGSWVRGEIDTQLPSFSDFVSQQLLNLEGFSEAELDMIVANNYSDPDFAQRISLRTSDGEFNFISSDGTVIIGKPTFEISPRYVSFNLNGSNNPESYEVYKRVGEYATGELDRHLNAEVMPVYVRMKKRGYHDNKHNDVYEYGWNFSYEGNTSNIREGFDYDRAIRRAVEYISSTGVYFSSSKAKAAADALSKVYTNEALASGRWSSNVKQEINTYADEKLSIQPVLPSSREQYEIANLQIDLREDYQNDPSEYTMQSGGAPGADSVWGDIASEFGIVNQNHWYHGETSQNNAPRGNMEISPEDYEEGRYKAALAAKMNWGYKYDTMKDDRLVRNWAQVKYADAIFAIGHIVGSGERVFPNQKDDTRTASTTVVQGGTGYAVGMAILEGKPVYVFDQERGKWAANINGEWEWLSEPPVLTKNFAGIGTRQINDAGKLAIRDVIENTFARIDDQRAEEEVSEQNNKLSILSSPVSQLDKEFGRKVISPSERKYIQETVRVYMNGKQLTQQLINDIENGLSDLMKAHAGYSNNDTIDLTYNKWKQLTELPYDEDWEDAKDAAEEILGPIPSPKYNEDRKTVTVKKWFIDLLNAFNNKELLDFIDEFGFIDRYESMARCLTIKQPNIISMIDNFRETQGITILEFKDAGLDIVFDYKDSRLLELFDDSEFSDEAMNYCKG